MPKSISDGGGPSDGQRVGLLLVGVEHDGPPATSEPLPCRPPPPRPARSSPPAVEKLAKGVPVPGFTVPAPLGSSRRVRKEYKLPIRRQPAANTRYLAATLYS